MKTPARQGHYLVSVPNQKEQIPAFFGTEGKSKEKIWYGFSRSVSTEHFKKIPLNKEVLDFSPMPKSQIEFLASRDLTEAELIEKAFLMSSEQKSICLDYKMPQSRKLKIGDEVVMGGWKDAVVVAEHPEIEGIYALRYTSVNHNYGKPIETPNQIGAQFWYEIYKKSDAIKSKESERIRVNSAAAILKEMRAYTCSMDSILFRRLHSGLQDNPSFQRGYVWSLSDKENLLQSIFDGNPIGAFIFGIDKSYQTKNQFVIDGKQRLNAICEYYCSLIPFQGKYYHELNFEDAYAFSNVSIPVMEIDLSKYREKELIELFLVINKAGVPQAPEHLNSLEEKLKSLS